MKKKYLYLLAGVLLCFGLTACAKTSQKETNAEAIADEAQQEVQNGLSGENTEEEVAEQTEGEYEYNTLRGELGINTPDGFSLDACDLTSKELKLVFVGFGGEKVTVNWEGKGKITSPDYLAYMSGEKTEKLNEIVDTIYGKMYVLTKNDSAGDTLDYCYLEKNGNLYYIERRRGTDTADIGKTLNGLFTGKTKDEIEKTRSPQVEIQGYEYTIKIPGKDGISGDEIVDVFGFHLPDSVNEEEVLEDGGTEKYDGVRLFGSIGFYYSDANERSYYVSCKLLGSYEPLREFERYGKISNSETDYNYEIIGNVNTIYGSLPVISDKRSNNGSTYYNDYVIFHINDVDVCVSAQQWGEEHIDVMQQLLDEMLN